MILNRSCEQVYFFGFKVEVGIFLQGSQNMETFSSFCWSKLIKIISEPHSGFTQIRYLPYGKIFCIVNQRQTLIGDIAMEPFFSHSAA